MEKLKFAQYYNITDVAKAHNTEYDLYENIYICVDVRDYWITRILVGWEDTGNDLVQNEDSFLLERINIPKDNTSDEITCLHELHSVLDKDDFSNWDMTNCDSVEDAEYLMDDGFGLGTLKL